MLTAAAPEPHIQRLLSHLAATLCDHSVRASASDPRRLLPALDSKFVDPVLGVAAPLAVGGQLAEASGGVLLLCSSTLDTKRSIGLGQYMAAGQAALGGPTCPELCVPVEATLWTLVHEQGGCANHGRGKQLHVYNETLLLQLQLALLTLPSSLPIHRPVQVGAVRRRRRPAVPHRAHHQPLLAGGAGWDCMGFALLPAPCVAQVLPLPERASALPRLTGDPQTALPPSPLRSPSSASTTSCCRQGRRPTMSWTP